MPFCVIDLETTGGSPTGCGITEIGALRFKGGDPDGTFHTLVNPHQEIPAFITVLTGITQAMVIEAPPVEQALPALLEFIGEAVVVGHNVRFDLSFLNAAAERLGYGRLPNRSVDTHALARRLVRSELRDLRLGTLAAFFRSPTTPNHRALEDARATAYVLWGLLERAGTIGITHLEDLLQLPTARGAAHYGKIRLADSLPRRPGVYLFRDRAGEIFYVGKAANLRTRVRSYFYGDDRRRADQMLRELTAIDHRVCPTELEAEVTELRLIRAHNPRHNRRSRPAPAPHWLRLTDEAFPRLSLVRSVRPGDGLLHLGPFRGQAAARLVAEAIWDALPLRRCSGPPGRRSAPCAPAQLGVALCPCDGQPRPRRLPPGGGAPGRGGGARPGAAAGPPGRPGGRPGPGGPFRGGGMGAGPPPRPGPGPGAPPRLAGPGPRRADLRRAPRGRRGAHRPRPPRRRPGRPGPGPRCSPFPTARPALRPKCPPTRAMPRRPTSCGAGWAGAGSGCWRPRGHWPCRRGRCARLERVEV